jgi:hypothetical protein
MQFDPNNDIDLDAISAWIELSDFYTFPYVVSFSSWKDLMVKLVTTDFQVISRRMHEFNEQQERELLQQWHKILVKIDRAKQERKTSNKRSRDFQTALKEEYGYMVDEEDCLTEAA